MYSVYDRAKDKRVALSVMDMLEKRPKASERSECEMRLEYVLPQY